MDESSKKRFYPEHNKILKSNPLPSPLKYNSKNLIRINIKKYEDNKIMSNREKKQIDLKYRRKIFLHYKQEIMNNNNTSDKISFKDLSSRAFMKEEM